MHGFLSSLSHPPLNRAPSSTQRVEHIRPSLTPILALTVARPHSPSAMPAFHEALIGGVRITYTIERDGTLLLALSDLAPSDPARRAAGGGGGRKACARCWRTRPTRRGSSRTARCGAPAVEPFVSWVQLPGPPVPDRPGALVPALLLQGQQIGAVLLRRLDPSAVTADGWRTPSSRRCCARGRRTWPGPPVGALAAVGARRAVDGGVGVGDAARQKLFCAAPAFAAALWLCTGAGAPRPPRRRRPRPSAEAPRRGRRSWKNSLRTRCLRRCWDARRTSTRGATSSGLPRRRRPRRSSATGAGISGRLSAVVRAGGALVAGVVAAPLATATLVLAALWAAGVLAAARARAARRVRGGRRLGGLRPGGRPSARSSRGSFFGHLIHTRTLAATPWLQRWPWRLHLRVHAEDFGFGNPPGFPHTFFVEARTVGVHVVRPPRP